MESSSAVQTDHEEELVQECQEFWGRANDDPTVRGYSHWFGYGKFQSRKAWERIGQKTWSKFLKLLTLAGEPLENFQHVIEWGVGGGSNVVAFLRHFKVLHGVDVSAASLDECRRVVEEAGAADRFFGTRIHESRECELEHERSFDLFLSTATYQHFPSKYYAQIVTGSAFDLLRSGGLALIQTRWDDGSSYYASKTRDYARGKNAIRFTSFGLKEFADICKDCGFEVLWCGDVEPGISYAWSYLRKPS